MNVVLMEEFPTLQVDPASWTRGNAHQKKYTIMIMIIKVVKFARRIQDLMICKQNVYKMNVIIIINI